MLQALSLGLQAEGEKSDTHRSLGHVNGDHLRLSGLSRPGLLQGNGAGSDGSPEGLLLDVEQALLALDPGQSQRVQVVKHRADDGNEAKDASRSKVPVLQNLELSVRDSVRGAVRVELPHAREVEHDDGDNEEGVGKAKVKAGVELPGSDSQAEDQVAALVGRGYAGNVGGDEGDHGHDPENAGVAGILATRTERQVL